MICFLSTCMKDRIVPIKTSTSEMWLGLYIWIHPGPLIRTHVHVLTFVLVGCSSLKSNDGPGNPVHDIIQRRARLKLESYLSELVSQVFTSTVKRSIDITNGYGYAYLQLFIASWLSALCTKKDSSL